MACLDNIVGVRGCSNAPTGVYLQNLTGITIADFDLAINTEQKAALPALQDIVQFATDYTLNNIRQYLSTKYELKAFIENDRLGYYYDNKEVIAADAGYLTGYEVRIDKTPYLSFEVGALSLFVNTTGQIDVYVYDLIQGKLLDTISVDAVAGEIVTVYPKKSYATDKQRLHLFIGYASVASYKTSYTRPYSVAYENCCGACYNNGHIYFGAKKILSASQKISDNLETNSYGAGLSFTYSLSCSFDEYLCAASSQLAFPILYKAGELVMQELKHSKRLQGAVTGFRATHDELMQYYSAEHLRLMGDLMNSIKLPESVCFSCNKKTKSVVNLP
jgi:hypothetical protein